MENPKQNPLNMMNSVEDKLSIYFITSVGYPESSSVHSGFSVGIVLAMKHPEWAQWYYNNMSKAKNVQEILADKIVERIPAGENDDSDIGNSRQDFKSEK